MQQTLLISLGAILGANARYWVGVWAAGRFGVGFPHGTLLVNVTGCFLIGLLNGLGESRLPVSPEVRFFAAVGFLGAYTTFSSFGFESINLLRAGSAGLAALNILGNLLLGFAAVVLGLYTGRLLG
jgi:CrcB protein